MMFILRFNINGIDFMINIRSKFVYVCEFCGNVFCICYRSFLRGSRRVFYLELRFREFRLLLIRLF